MKICRAGLQLVFTFDNRFSSSGWVVPQSVRYIFFRLQPSYLSATSHTGRKSCRVKILYMKRFWFGQGGQHGPSIRYKITPCWVTLLQPTRRAAVLGQPSSLRPHWSYLSLNLSTLSEIFTTWRWMVYENIYHQFMMGCDWRLIL
jgi:hypothetical protein